MSAFQGRGMGRFLLAAAAGLSLACGPQGGEGGDELKPAMNGSLGALMQQRGLT